MQPSQKGKYQCGPYIDHRKLGIDYTDKSAGAMEKLIRDMEKEK